MTQAAGNLIITMGEALSARRFLIRDHDTKFSAPFYDVFATEGLRVTTTPTGLTGASISGHPTRAPPRTTLSPSLRSSAFDEETDSAD